MKKRVPDPPRFIPYFTLQTDLPTPDALAHASQLLRGVSETLDEHCRLHAGDLGLHMLSNAAYAADMARALIEQTMARYDSPQEPRP